MADDVQRLAVLIEANTRSYENAMRKLQASTNKAIGASTKSLATLDSRLKGVAATAGKFAAGFGIGLGLGALQQVSGAIRDVVREGAGIVDTADKIGVTTEELQKLRFAGEQSGVEIGELDNALAKFSKELGNASRGQGDLGKILAANGVALRDQAGNMRPLIEQFADYADLVNRAASSQERNLLVTTAFGRAADEMGGLFRNGADGVRVLLAEADRLGVVIGDDKLRRIAEIDDQWDAFATTLSTNVKSAILTVVSQFSDLATGQSDASRAADAHREAMARINPVLASLSQATDQAVVSVAALGDEFIISARKATAAAGVQLQAARSIAEANAQAFIGPTVSSTHGGTFTDIDFDTQARIAEVAARDPAVVRTLQELDARAKALKEIEAKLAVINAEVERRDISIKSTVLPTTETHGAGGGAGGSSAADKVGDVVKALEDQRLQLGRTDREQAIYNELAKAGVDINSEAGQKIAALAGRNYDLAHAMETSAAASEVLQAQLAEIRDAGQEFASTFLHGIMDGKKATEALGDALTKLADRLLDSGLTMLFDALFGGGAAGGTGGGLFRSLLSGLFGGARAEGGPVSAGKAYLVGEKRPEIFIPRTAGRIDAGRSLTASAPLNFTFAPNIDARGGDAATPGRIEAIMAVERKRFFEELPSAIRAHRANRRI